MSARLNESKLHAKLAGKSLDPSMSTTTAFISELIRAANEVEKLGDFENRRLLDREPFSFTPDRRTMRAGLFASVPLAFWAAGFMMFGLAFADWPQAHKNLRA